MSDEQKTGDEAQQGGQGEVPVKSSTPENAEGKINPAAPGETGTSSKQKSK